MRLKKSLLITANAFFCSACIFSRTDASDGGTTNGASRNTDHSVQARSPLRHSAVKIPVLDAGSAIALYEEHYASGDVRGARVQALDRGKSWDIVSAEPLVLLQGPAHNETQLKPGEFLVSISKELGKAVRFSYYENSQISLPYPNPTIAKLEDWQSFAKSHPKSTVAHLRLGKAWEQSGNVDRAKKEYKEAVLMDPQDTEAKGAIERLEPTIVEKKATGPDNRKAFPPMDLSPVPIPTKTSNGH